MQKFTNHLYTKTVAGECTVHDWRLRGPDGGLNFHVHIIAQRPEFQIDPIAGLEYHNSITSKNTEELATSGFASIHQDCDLTGGKCWHTGTSMYATETLWPMIKVYLRIEDHARIFDILEYEYKLYFERTNDD